MKRLYFFALLCCWGLGLAAQIEIGGTIVDTTGNSLPGANVILLRSSDSLLTAFATTGNKGEFLLQNVGAGEYLLTVSYLGYERPEQTLEVSQDDQYLGLGDLTMYPAGFLLNGVEVTADRIPIRMKGDTMMYDAEAFAVGENAAVEDLLRRLPGMSIDANGNITWRGQTVQQVMINGKPFFAGNNTLITQNLDAAAIKSVEVFDQKSNKEELTGVDDGEENTTVNLEMKEEFKAKFFGELYAGYGTQRRYDGGAKLFRISDASQLGLLGTINNVNRVGFSGDEMMSFNRNLGRGGWFVRGRNGGQGNLPVTSGDQTPGQNRSIAAGLNFGTSLGKGQLQLGYALYDRELTQLQTIEQAFNQQGGNRNVTSRQVDATNSYSHRVSANFEMDIDTISRLNANTAFFIVGNDDLGASQVSIRDPRNGDQDYTVEELNENRRPAGDFSIDYARRLGKPGRTLELEANGDFGRRTTDLDVLTQGLDEQLNIPGALVNGRQTQDRITTDNRYGANVNYEEPLSKKWQWETEVSYVIDESEADFRFRLEEETAENLLTRRWDVLRAGTGLVHRFGQRNNFTISGRYFNTQLELSGDQNRAQTYQYFLPEARLRIRGKKGFYRLRMSASPVAPDVSQLQTIAQPGRSGRVSIGNPDLTPAVNYRANGFVWWNDEFRALSLNANVSLNYDDNAFGNSLTFTQGQQVFQTVNVSHAWTGNVFAGMTMGVDAINGELRLNGRVGGSRGQGFVDGQSQTNTTTNLSGSVNLTTELNEQSFLTAGYTYGANRNAFADEDTEAIVAVTHDLLAQFELEISPKWRFESRFLYRIFEEVAFAGAADIPDLRASLELRPFKKAPHYFRLAVFDVFNQNTVINRQAQAFVTSETTSDALGRYFLGTFHYRFR